jgi:DivIVA domain-containing protein
MDDEMQNQLRTITFSEERKGYDKGEVRQFLSEVAEWIEGGGGDVVRRRLERIAHKSAKILADAEDGAESLRREAEQETRELLEGARAEADSCRATAEAEAREQLREARVESTSTREAANQYASETGRKADEYAEQTRSEAKRESDELRENAAKEAKQAVRSAEQRAEQIIAEANRRRADVEKVIDDLNLERDAVVAQVRKLALELGGTADKVESETGGRPAATAEVDPTAEREAANEGKAVEGLRVVGQGNGAGAV